MTTRTVDFQRLFEASPGLFLVITADEAFTILAVSDAYLEATLTQRIAIVGRGLFEVFPDNPNDPAADGVRNLKASLARVLKHKKADSMAVQKYSIARADGSFEVRHWSPRNFPVLGPGGELQCIIHRVEDVTEYVARADRMEAEVLARAHELQQANVKLRELTETLELNVHQRTLELAGATAERNQLEAQFRQAQKMDAVGQLAGGVAHDFNNLLTVILSCAELAKSNAPPSMIEELADIEGAAQRAAALTRQLLAFSRTHVVNPVDLDLNVVVEESSGMLRRLLGEHINLATVLGADLANVRVDRSQLDQVLLNLVVNARDAMPTGGALTIETANLELDGSREGALGAKAGQYVMLAVTDTGVGMDEATQQKMFTPFFTTKAIGRGTGLGLAMVHGVVKQCEGELIVYSTLGKGTTFKVLLPARANAERRLPSVVLELPPARAGETVLLVEDEERVREVARRVLTRAGYKVLTAAGPNEALALADDTVERLDLIITDVVMPGMDGPSFVDKLARAPSRAQTRVLFMSGYTGGALVHQRVIAPNVGFLQKPFVPSQLLRRVRECLG